MYRYHGKANVDKDNPRAFARCDRCGFIYNSYMLKWQSEYAGPGLYNTRLRVCDKCLDVPNQQFKTIRIPADPLPIKDPRTENFEQEQNSTVYVQAQILNGAWVLVEVEDP